MYQTKTTMRFPQLATLFLGWLVASVAASLSTQEMVKLADKGPANVIRLTDENWKPILEGPREFSLVLVMTTELAQVNCIMCNEIKPVVDQLALLWHTRFPQGLKADRDDGTSDVFFLLADFTDCKTLFQALLLLSIPKVYLLAPRASQGPWINDLDEYKFYHEDQMLAMHQWVRQLTGVNYELVIPVDYTNIITNVVLVVLLVVLVAKFHSRIITLVLLRLLWCGLLVVAVLLFTTGYMFTKMRNAPYVRERGNNVEYILKGHQQQQLGMETQIASFLYGSLSLLVVLLIKRVPTIKNPAANLIGVVMVLALILLFYSALLTVFGMKSPDFPYRFITLFS